MKRFLPLFVIIVLSFATSCTREYTCQCEVTYSGNPPGLPGKEIHEHAIKNTKKDAAKECEANSTKETENGITMDVKCQLF